jgi:Fanconi anemia group M protein
VYEVTVEKIYPGSAVLLINNKYRARLAYQDFEGPTSVIKKNSRFKATAELYRSNNTLCIRILQVIQFL